MNARGAKEFIAVEQRFLCLSIGANLVRLFLVSVGATEMGCSDLQENLQWGLEVTDSPGC